MSKTCSPEDALILEAKQGRLVSALDSLQRHALGRRSLLEEGLVHASSFASAWGGAMEEVEEKKRELEQFEVVGVDIDTVKTQLEEYKVRASN